MKVFSDQLLSLLLFFNVSFAVEAAQVAFKKDNSYFSYKDAEPLKKGLFLNPYNLESSGDR